MTKVECPECGGEFEAESDVLFLFNRINCSLCDALLEVIEEEPLVLEAVDEEYYDSEDEDEDDEWEAE